MLRKLFSALTLLIALPAMANAAVWTVKASSANPTFGSVSPSGYTNLATTTLSKTITVTPGANYKISSIMVNNVDKKVGTATQDVVVPMKTGTTIVVANFATKTFSVTAGPVVGGGGQIASTTTTQVNAGASKSFTVTPFTGYKILTVKDNGANVALDAFNNLTFTNVQDNHVVTATFGGVTANAGTNQTAVVGSAVTLAGSGTVPAGDTAAYQWSVVYAPVDASISTATALPAGPALSFVANKVGTYNLNLKVTDGAALSATSAVAVTVFADNAALLAASVNQCTGCHSGTTAFATSSHNGKISCQDCHTADPHSSVATVAICVTCHKAPYAPEAHTAAQNACNTCHNVHTLGLIAGTIAAQHTITTSTTSTTITCADCHAAHTDGAPFHKAQYVSTASLPVTCANCHSGADNRAILAQYAGSAHADTAGEAWLHFDWRGANRAACARCHNGSAFVTKLGSENNISSVFLPGDILKPGEILACSACHSNVGTGELRTPSVEFTINMTNSKVAYHVDGASGLCVRCHSGRETGASIKNDTDTTGVRMFVDSHYQPAAGTLYNKSGYDYGDNATLGGHKTLGALSQGPCVSCHMAGKDHSFAAAGCVTCHNGTEAPTLTIDAATMKANYDTALNNLKSALAAKGIHYGPVHPYFFTTAYVEGGINAPVTNWAAPYGAANWKHTMGAAFNYNLLWSEKGAYAHDYNYAMKLIADSIDFISDGALGL